MSIVHKSLFIFLCISLLGSCGFHLRGSLELSAEITPIFIKKGGDEELNSEIRSLLSGSGQSNLTLSKNEAKAILKIASTKKKRRVVAVDRRGRVRQYELSFIVRYSVAGKNIPQVDDDNINMMDFKRTVIFDPDNVLAIGHEIDRIYSEMRKDSARLIVQRLQALGSKPGNLKAINEKPE